MGSRRQARQLVIQVLFHLEFNPDEPQEAFDSICENFGAGESIRLFAKNLVLGVCVAKEELDCLIRQASTNWRLERMSRLDRSILRLGTFELLHAEDIPSKVSIDEAVELGKIFGGEDSGRFINGVLDRIYTILAQEGRIKREVNGLEAP
jgi:transcription antitermination factor NusB